MSPAENQKTDCVNIAAYLNRAVKTRLYKCAVVCPSGRDKNGRVTYAHLTFLQLDRESDYLDHGLEAAAGITRGIRTPYGATEAVPIISIKSKEILSETSKLSDKAFGTCIGRPINDMDIRIIKSATNPCEALFNNHPRVYRSALVGVGSSGRQKPVMCIELQKPDDGKDKNQLKRELLKIAAENDLTRNIEQILFHSAFPVDIRHNSKIFCEKLALWAENKLR